MKENEFDIYVRNLMGGAEESVSPDVWKGIEARLDQAAAPKKTVPVWLWRSLGAVAAAAAVVAAVVLTGPEKDLSNQPTINTVASATDETLPEETLPEEDVTPVMEQVSRLRTRTARVWEAPSLDMTEEPEKPLVSEAVVPEDERRPESIIGRPSFNQDETLSADADAFNRLAFEEHKTHRKGTFSMSIQGNLQSNTRPESPSSTIRRTSGLFIPPDPSRTGILSESPEFSFGLPVSAGIGFRYDFTPRWGIGTGILYTNLSRSFLGDYREVENGPVLYDTDINNQLHYIGVPLNLFFNIVNDGYWNVHVRLDGTAEKLLDNHFVIHDSGGDIHYRQKVDPLQLSTGVGIGVEFKFTPYLGIYFDPTIRYYFDCGQPRSLRTIQPLRMDFEVGLRFSPKR